MAIEDDILAHINDTNNAHNLDKHLVGLGQLDNFPIATTVEAEAGIRSDRYLTPLNLNSIFDGILKRAGRMDADGNIIIIR